MHEFHGPPVPSFREHHGWHSPLRTTSDHNDVGRTGMQSPGYVLDEFSAGLLFCSACRVVLRRPSSDELAALAAETGGSES